MEIELQRRTFSCGLEAGQARPCNVGQRDGVELGMDGVAKSGVDHDRELVAVLASTVHGSGRVLVNQEEAPVDHFQVH